MTKLIQKKKEIITKEADDGKDRLASLKGVLYIIDFHLGARHPEYSLVMQTCTDTHNITDTKNRQEWLSIVSDVC